jgi:hypothetical protein
MVTNAPIQELGIQAFPHKWAQPLPKLWRKGAVKKTRWGEMLHQSALPGTHT